MKATSPNSDAEPLMLAATRRSAGPTAPALVVGWRWLRSIRELSRKEGFPSGKKTARGRGCIHPRRLERSARAVLIWGLLFYAVFHLIPLVILARSSEHPWHTIATSMEAQKWPRLRQLVAEDPDRPLLLMLGSSRLSWAGHAGALNGMLNRDGRPLRVYNFGIPSSGPITQLLFLRDLLAAGIRPRILLLEFNPMVLCAHERGALNEEEMMCVETIDLRQFLRCLPYFDCPGKDTYRWLSARLAPWSVFRYHMALEVLRLVKRVSCHTYDPIDEWGWRIALPKLWPAPIRSIRVAMTQFEYWAALQHFRWGKKPMQAFHEILDRCRHEKIPVVLVVMPESSEFRSWYPNEAKTAIRSLLSELSQTYGIGVIDANCWLPDEYFEDGHHVLLQGAEAFTRRLHDELIPLLAKSASD